MFFKNFPRFFLFRLISRRFLSKIIFLILALAFVWTSEIFTFKLIKPNDIQLSSFSRSNSSAARIFSDSAQVAETSKFTEILAKSKEILAEKMKIASEKINFTRPIIPSNLYFPPKIIPSKEFSRPPPNPKWADPPVELAGLVPPFPHSASFLPSPTDSPEIISRRFSSIVSLFPRFPPSSFPIGVVAHNRPESLEISLSSLFNVSGLVKSQVAIYQDGDDARVAAVARKFGVRLVQNLKNSVAEGFNEPGAARIARHYKFTLTHLFAENPTANLAIVVEDDMIFSPDFLLYFVQTAILYDDPSIYCISSFSDNGFISHAYDPRYLYRTEFFIGLGWMVKREIYEKEFEPRWPPTHWDHWMRQDSQRQGRDCIFPEVSRNYNIGKRGTHSDDNLFRRYFQSIALNQQQAVWLGDLSRMENENYRRNFESELFEAKIVQSIDQIEKFSNSSLALYWQCSDQFVHQILWENYFSHYFHLWHSWPIRSNYRGAVKTRFKGNSLVIIPSYSEFGKAAKEKFSSIPLIAPLELLTKNLTESMTIETAARAASCSETCHAKEKFCSQLSLHLINNCDSLKKYFPCENGCRNDSGADQPVYVSDKGNAARGECLVNSKTPDCDGSHHSTSRLCVCQTLE